MEFKINDIVKHKTILDSPMMTVGNIDWRGVYCRWFDTTACLQWHYFEPDELELLERKMVATEGGV